MAQQKAKKVAIRRRRERKNIESGAVHIQSTFNNTIVTIQIHRVMLFHGQVQADLVSEVQESLHRLQRRQQLKQQLRQLWNMALRA